MQIALAFTAVLMLYKRFRLSSCGITNRSTVNIFLIFGQTDFLSSDLYDEQITLLLK